MRSRIIDHVVAISAILTRTKVRSQFCWLSERATRAVVVLLLGTACSVSVVGLAGRKTRLWSAFALLGRVLLHLAFGTTLLRLAPCPFASNRSIGYDRRRHGSNDLLRPVLQPNVRRGGVPFHSTVRPHTCHLLPGLVRQRRTSRLCRRSRLPRFGRPLLLHVLGRRVDRVCVHGPGAGWIPRREGIRPADAKDVRPGR